MKESKELRAGVVGLGGIGGGVAVSLVNKGRVPAAYDIVPGLSRKLKVVPEQLESPADVAAVSDIIMIAVFNFEQCKQAIMGETGLLKNAHKGMVIVILSTIAVDEVKELYDVCRKKGVGVLDCGVTPGTLAAKNGMVAMVGGDKDVFEYAKPVLDDWSGITIYCGESGTGMACKIARNVNTYGVWRVTAESFRLAVAAGVDPNTFLQVLDEADKMDNLFYNMIRKRIQMPDYKLPEGMASASEYMEKDLKASKKLSESLGICMPTRDHLMHYCKDTFDCEECANPNNE